MLKFKFTLDEVLEHERILYPYDKRSTKEEQIEQRKNYYIKMTKVLVVATSRKTRGGITSVIKAHETGEQWKNIIADGLRLIETVML